MRQILRGSMRTSGWEPSSSRFRSLAVPPSGSSQTRCQRRDPSSRTHGGSSHSCSSPSSWSPSTTCTIAIISDMKGIELISANSRARRQTSRKSRRRQSSTNWSDKSSKPDLMSRSIPSWTCLKTRNWQNLTRRTSKDSLKLTIKTFGKR
jgi:hypothetical protein